MKYLLISLVLCLPLSGCLVDDVEPVEAKIPYPALVTETDFIALLEKSSIDVADSQLVYSDVFVRLMNVVGIASHMADVLADGVAPNPVFKSMSREFQVLDATSDLCPIEQNENSKTSSLIWNDVDNNGQSSKGDEWYFIWEGCENSSNNSTINGVMSFTGMTDPNTSDNDNDFGKNPFTDYVYSFDLELSGLNENTVFFKDTKFTFSFDGVGVATLKILPGSVMGVKSPDDIYLFSVNDATFVSDDDEDTLDINFDAQYFDSTLDGHINVNTSDNLVFGYSWATINSEDIIITPRLTAGTLELTAKDEKKSSLVVDSDETKLKMDVDGEDPETIDQTEFFENEDGRFSLVNLTGG